MRANASITAGGKRDSSLSVSLVCPQVRPRSQRGAAIASAGFMPKTMVRVKTALCVCGWPSPPMLPYTIARPSERSASAGLSVWKGLRPGASALSAPSSSEKLQPRFCQLMPDSASTTPLPYSW